MKNAQKGSMLLEALIALGLTSFLTIAITRITGDVAKSVSTVQAIAQQHQKIIAVTNQLERDLSALVVIHVTQEAEDKNSPDTKSSADPKKKKISRALMGNADHNDTIKIEKKDFPTFKIINGLTTSPLQSYGENKPHLVRFSYKIIKQTPAAPHNKVRAFKLYRKETADLDDLNLKKDGELKDNQIATSSEWVLICDNISDFFIQYSTYAPEAKNPEPTTPPVQSDRTTDIPPKKTPLEQIHSFTWPIKKLGEDFKQCLPHSINVILRLWNTNFTKTFDYQIIIPCMAYASTLPENAAKTSSDRKKSTKNIPAVDSINPKNSNDLVHASGAGPLVPPGVAGKIAQSTDGKVLGDTIELKKATKPYDSRDEENEIDPRQSKNQAVALGKIQPTKDPYRPSAEKKPELSPDEKFEDYINNIPQQKLEAIAERLSQMTPEETENFHALSQALEANPELMQKITSDPEFMEHAREMFK